MELKIILYAVLVNLTFLFCFCLVRNILQSYNRYKSANLDAQNKIAYYEGCNAALTKPLRAIFINPYSLDYEDRKAESWSDGFKFGRELKNKIIDDADKDRRAKPKGGKP